MKKRSSSNYASLALLCCCCLAVALSGADGLPITSKPLDNNPDHLTWEAAWLSEDSRHHPVGGKSKKITPKSIFITPNLNGANESACPPDSKVDHTGKCIHVVNINTADILVTKLQSLFSQNGDSNQGGGIDDYDYDYDSSGPFQVNLPLSIDLPPEPPQMHQSVQPPHGGIFFNSAPTYEREGVRFSTTIKEPFLGIRTETSASASATDQVTAESHTDVSFLAVESLPNGTLASQLELDGNNRTVVQSVLLSSAGPSASSTAATEPTTELDSTLSTTTADLGDLSDAADDPDADGTSTVLLSTTTTDTSSTTMLDSTMTTEQDTDLTEETVLFSTTTAATTPVNVKDLDQLRQQLADESLLMNNDTTLPTENSPSEDEGSESPSTSIMSTERAVSTTVKVLIHTMPPVIRDRISPSPVQIVTPMRNRWYSPPGVTPPSFIIASQTQKDRTTRASPETTTVSLDRSTEAPPPLLTLKNDTITDKQNRDSIMRQEANDNRRETIDTGNRFVYHHLPVSVTPPVATSTVRPDSSYLEQLRRINEIVAENKRRHQQQEQQLATSGAASSRIRFPSPDDRESLVPAASSSSSSSSSVVKFPGSVNNRIPENYSTKKAASLDSTTTKPPFWWLPSGWEVDQTGSKPMLLRFWSRMPLVLDSSVHSSSSSSTSPGGATGAGSPRWRSATGFTSTNQQHPVSVARRGNSRSPSESFYREVPGQDVYKVMNAQQLKQTRR